ncbi:MAG: hypothetical protein AAGI53_03565 [Planctomycetota bacterium]
MTTPDVWRDRVPQGAPARFVPHTHAFEFVHAAPRERVWAWLNDPGTFTRQVWPYRVEFVAGGFDEGALNVHHGPFLNVAGMMTEVDAGDDGKGRRRELRYFYGSNVISLRFIRPTALVFEVEDADANGSPATRIRGQLDSLVSPMMKGPWSLIQKTFWPSFRFWIRREVKA